MRTVSFREGTKWLVEIWPLKPKEWIFSPWRTAGPTKSPVFFGFRCLKKLRRKKKRYGGMYNKRHGKFYVWSFSWSDDFAEAVQFPFGPWKLTNMEAANVSKHWKTSRKPPAIYIYINLVGGFNPFEKYWSNWIIPQSRGENKKYLKPPRYLGSNFC